MSFRIRRVVSGLSPSEHVAGTKLSSMPTQSKHSQDGGSPRDFPPRVKRLSVDIDDFMADGSDTLDSRQSRRERGDESGHSRKSSNPSSISVDHAGSPTRRSAQTEVQTDDIDLRSDNAAHAKSGFRLSPSVPKESRINLGVSAPVENIEFDSSDHNSPQKIDWPSSMGLRLNASGPSLLTDETNASKKETAETVRPSEQSKPLTYTPRRSSPLRKEVVHSAHSSSAGDLVEEIRHSSALRSRSTQEILDQINSSMDKMRADASQHASPNKKSESEDSSSSNEEDSIGAVRLQGLSHFVPKDVLQNLVKDRSSELVSPKPIRMRTTRKEVEKDTPKTRKRPLDKEVRGYSAKKVRVGTKGTNFNAWSFEKWDKLKRLVDSPVPNSVIVKNAIVMKELGCESEQELQQRVDFLLRNKSR